jgi:vacuolar-type H+-ATPase subunit I/STV1
MRVITHGGAQVNGHGRKDSHTSFVSSANGSMAFCLRDAMGINFILLAMVVVGALLLLYAHMLKLRRFWSQHKEDTLLALLLISLFIGAFVLIFYLLVHRFEQPTSPSLATPPILLTSIGARLLLFCCDGKKVCVSKSSWRHGGFCRTSCAKANQRFCSKILCSTIAQ